MTRFSLGEWTVCQIAIGFASVVLALIILGAVWRYGFSLLREALGDGFLVIRAARRGGCRCGLAHR